MLLWGALQAAPLSWPVADDVLVQTTAQLRPLADNAAAIRIEGRALALPAQVSRFYRQRDYRPLWVDRQGILIDAGELLRVVKEAESEGLPVWDYPVATLEKFLLGAIDTPRQLAQLDLLLTDTFLLYSRNVRSGRLGPHRVGGNWFLPYTPFDASDLLSRVVKDCSISEALAALPPPHTGYRRLRAILQHYRALAAQGGWPQLTSGETLRNGNRGPRVAALRERLRLSGDLPDQQSGEADLFDLGVSDAVMRFQRRHGLEADGSVGKRTLAMLNVPIAERIRQIEANMERWRWMPREMAAHRIEVNMAGYELAVLEQGTAVLQMRVIVGRNYRQTPVFASEVTDVVLNPSWYVPRLIFREDILPALRRDPGRLKRLNMRLLKDGSEVDASNIDWSRVDGDTFPYTLRQDPGPQNALGRIKFLMPNSHGIYLHDTPDRHLFERNTRAFSSGCIRLEKPLELAEYLLADPDEWSVATLQQAIDSEEPRGLALPEPESIYFTYWTAWVDQAGLLQVREDIYHRDRRLLGLWRKSAT